MREAGSNPDTTAKKEEMKIEFITIGNVQFWRVTTYDYSYSSKDLGKAIFKCIGRMPQ